MDIDSVLKKWNDAKIRKTEVEKECEIYKEAVERYMAKKDKNKIESADYSVQRRSITRESLTKNEVPPEIWAKI